MVERTDLLEDFGWNRYGWFSQNYVIVLCGKNCNIASNSFVQDITTILNLSVVVYLTSECLVAGTVAGIED